VRLFYSWAPVLMIMLGIFFLSAQPSLPGPGIAGWDYLFKKSAHVIVYAALYLASYRALALTNPGISPIVQAVLPVVIAIAYGASDEFHQTFVPGRSGTLRDVGFDSLGVLIAFLTLYRYI
jgi:VanZ family protein